MPSAAPQPKGNPSHNAHRFETVTVYYRWHPLFGQSLEVRQRKKGTDGEYVVCQLANGTSLSIPAWMLNPECAQLALGPPQIAVAALLELRDLLSALPFASGCPLPSFREEAAADEATVRTVPAVESIVTDRDIVRDSRRQA